jgi:hypothetical protein
MSGWDGDLAYWRMESGTIVGETKASAIPKQNTFLNLAERLAGRF